MKKHQQILNCDLESVVASIPLSDTTIGRRIEVLAADLDEQTFTGARASKCGLALQCDESTDIQNRAQLVVFGRWC